DVQIDEASPPRVLSFLVKNEPAENEKSTLIQLDGSSAPIHDINERVGLKLADAAQAKEYLLFFCAFVQGDDGAFNIVEPDGPLAKQPAVRRLLQDKAALSVEPDGEGKFKASANIAYGAAVFHAEFALEDSGAVEMTDDSPIGTLDAPLIE